MKTKNQSEKAWTLVEVMIGIAVIALLAAMVLPGYISSRQWKNQQQAYEKQLGALPTTVIYTYHGNDPVTINYSSWDKVSVAGLDREDFAFALRSHEARVTRDGKILDVDKKPSPTPTPTPAPTPPAEDKKNF